MTRNENGTRRDGGYVMPDWLRSKVLAAPEMRTHLTKPDYHSDRWDDAIHALDVFIAREGHARVTQPHVEAGIRLGSWVSKNRVGRANLSIERVTALESRAEWIWDAPGKTFIDGLSALDSFILREGHARVPQSQVEGAFTLGAWVSRNRLHRANLSIERVTALESRAGWLWDSLEQDFIDGLSALDAFILREGHASISALHVESGFKLGAWVSRKRTGRPKLSIQRVAALESRIGWLWSSLEQDFIDGLSHLDAFISREGHCRVPGRHVESGFNLGYWVGSKRVVRATLSSERVAALESRAGWLWNGRGKS